MKPIIALLLILPLVTQAQVNKCTVDGKVTFSDVACADIGAKEMAVNVKPNTLDTSGFREHVDRQQQIAQEAAQARQAAANERAQARAERRARQPTVCNTFGQSSGQFDADTTRYGSRSATTTGTYSGSNNSTTICNK